MTNAFTGDPVNARMTVTDGVPVGTLRAWAVKNDLIVESTTVTQDSNVLTAHFAGTLTVAGFWKVFFDETVSGVVPNVLGSVNVRLKEAPRP